MRRTAILAGSLALVFAASETPTQEASGATPASTCAKRYKVREFTRYALYTYSGSKLKPLRLSHLNRMQRCLVPSANRKIVIRWRSMIYSQWKAECRGGWTRVGLASVFSDTTSGIATRSYVNPWGFWLLRSPNGTTTVQRQTDWGPADWTGREFDLTADAANAHGYSYGGFPTDQGTWYGRFLGGQLPRGLHEGARVRDTLC